MSVATVTRIPNTKPAPAKRPTKAQMTAARREARAKLAMNRLAVAGAGLVWFTDLYSSYFHIAHLALRSGQSYETSYMLPAGVDGLMMVAAVAMIVNRDARLPKVTFGIGAGATIVANILSVQGFNPIGYGIAGWVAVSLIFSAEVLLRQLLPARRRPARKR